MPMGKPKSLQHLWECHRPIELAIAINPRFGVTNDLKGRSHFLLLSSGLRSLVLFTVHALAYNLQNPVPLCPES
jgi:hypothetical protein